MVPGYGSLLIYILAPALGGLFAGLFHLANHKIVKGDEDNQMLIN